MMFVMAAVSVLAAAAVPQLSQALEHARTVSAARYIAGRMAFARSQAVNGSANLAMLFSGVGEDVVVGMYVDGNGNGVRTRDIGAGADRLVGDRISLGILFPHVVVSLNDPIDLTTTSMLMSFTPLGTASSGTVYLRGRDGSQYAVRVLGATGRTRVLRYQPATTTWVEVL